MDTPNANNTLSVNNQKQLTKQQNLQRARRRSYHVLTCTPSYSQYIRYNDPCCPSCAPGCPPPIDDEENFLQSIMPYINKLSMLKKLQLRVIFQGILYKALEENESGLCFNEMSSYSPSKPICCQNDEERFYWGLIPYMKMLHPGERLQVRLKFSSGLQKVFHDPKEPLTGDIEGSFMDIDNDNSETKLKSIEAPSDASSSRRGSKTSTCESKDTDATFDEVHHGKVAMRESVFPSDMFTQETVVTVETLSQRTEEEDPVKEKPENSDVTEPQKSDENSKNSKDNPVELTDEQDQSQNKTKHTEKVSIEADVLTNMELKSSDPNKSPSQSGIDEDVNERS